MKAARRKRGQNDKRNAEGSLTVLSPIRRLAVWSAQKAYAKSEAAKRSEKVALTRLSELLLSTDCKKTNDAPCSRPTPGLAWLSCALDLVGPDALQRMLRSTVGAASWRPAHPPSDWSEQFSGKIALGEIIGPSGRVFSDSFRFGVALFGPDVVYEEHAHAATEVYFVLGANLLCARQHKTSLCRMAAGEFAIIEQDCRHDVRTEEEPVIALWAWLNDIDAITYRRAEGSWRGGDRVAVGSCTT